MAFTKENLKITLDSRGNVMSQHDCLFFHLYDMKEHDDAV